MVVKYNGRELKIGMMVHVYDGCDDVTGFVNWISNWSETFGVDGVSFDIEDEELTLEFLDDIVLNIGDVVEDKRGKRATVDDTNVGTCGKYTSIRYVDSSGHIKRTSDLSKVDVPKFNVGDNVTFTHDFHVFKCGETGVITKVERGYMGHIPYRVESDGIYTWVSPIVIEKSAVKFNVGDKVVAVGKRIMSNDDYTGVVTEANRRLYGYDVPDTHGYRLDNGYEYTEDQLHLVPDVEIIVGRKYKHTGRDEIVTVTDDKLSMSGSEVIVRVEDSNGNEFNSYLSLMTLLEDECIPEEPKRRFNVGDKVVVTNGGDGYKSDGTVGTIESIKTNVMPWIPYEVRFDDGVTRWMSGDVLKLNICDKPELNIGDKFEFGNWSIEVNKSGNDRELVLTNDSFNKPSVIRVIDVSNGWFRNGDNVTIFRDEFVYKK